jgi:glutamine amidotransferase
VTIAIIDYNAGNIASVKKAFDYLGFAAVVTRQAEQVRRADRIVLPGVGNFAATRMLDDTGLRDCIDEAVRGGIPFLGICLGMQWMLATSEEAPGLSGLGMWPEECSRFPDEVKSPHVGWNSLEGCKSESRLLCGVASESFAYFTHSYRVPLMGATVAECEYGGKFSAAIEHENIFGVQFHPEKSGDVGLKILSNFCKC